MVRQTHLFRYFTEKSHEDVPVLNSREFRAERKVNPTMFVKYEVDIFLKKRKLWASFIQVFPYNQNVFREFYANMSESCGDPEYARYGKVYVRGKVCSFTPELPNIDIPDWNMEGSVEKVLMSGIGGGGGSFKRCWWKTEEMRCKICIN